MEKTRIGVFLFFLICATQYLIAQPFIPDERGYIKDPKFHQLIKQKGYELVGAFDTVRLNPLILQARVVYNGIWKGVNQNGELIEYKEIISHFSGITSESIHEYHDEEEDVKIYYSNKFFKKIQIDGKYGTEHKQTKEKGIPAIYDELEFLDEDIAAIKLNGKYGLAEADGSILAKPKFDSIAPIYFRPGYTSKLYAVKKDDKFGAVNSRGKEVIPIRYHELSGCRECSKGNDLLKVRLGKKRGLINKANKEIILLQYSDIRLFHENHGLLKATKFYDFIYYNWLIDTNGKILMDSCQEISKTNSGHILFSKGETKKGLMGVNGKVLLQPVYSEIDDVQETGIVMVGKEDNHGLITLDGKVIIEPLFKELNPLYEDSLAYAVDWQRRWGLLNFTGDTIIPFEYEYLNILDSGIFYRKNGKYGLMDRNEKALKLFDFDQVKAVDDFLLVKRDNLFGIADLYGNILIPLKYNNINNYFDFKTDGIIEVTIDNKRYKVDRYGNEYLIR